MICNWLLMVGLYPASIFLKRTKPTKPTTGYISPGNPPRPSKMCRVPGTHILSGGTGALGIASCLSTEGKVVWKCPVDQKKKIFLEIFICIILTFRDIQRFSQAQHPSNHIHTRSLMFSCLSLSFPFRPSRGRKTRKTWRSRRNSWPKRAPKPSVSCREAVKPQQRPGMPWATHGHTAMAPAAMPGARTLGVAAGWKRGEWVMIHHDSPKQ